VRRGWWAAAVALTLLGAALRLHHLGFQELWLDEALQLRMATTERFAEALRLEYSPPLGYLLWRGWVGLFGEGEVAMRSLAALFGIAFVPIAIAAGRAIISPAAGLWAGAFAATAPLHVYYSQEARAYSLLCLAILLAHWTAWRALARPRPAAFAAFAASALLALFTHHYAALALAPAAGLAWAWPRDERTRARHAGFALAVAAAGLPWAAWIAWSWLANVQIERGYLWVTQVWRAIPPALAIPKSLEVLAFGPQQGSIPGFFKQFTILAFPAPLRALGWLALAGLAAVALGPWRDARLGLPFLGLRKAWLAAAALLPLLVLWGVSFALPTYVVARYDLVAFPAYALLVGLAFAKLATLRRAAPLAALVFFGLIGAKLTLYYTLPVFASGHAPSRETAAALDRVVAEGDLVVLTAYRGATVGYQLRRLGYRERDGRFEHAMGGRRFELRRLATHPSSLFFNVDHPERTRFDLEQVRSDLRADLAALDPARATVWVEALPDEPRLPRFRAMLAEELARADFGPAPLPLGLAPGHVDAFRSGARLAP
jgi:4-amino-4-deoxy-L-arabinose transferase-like glycosyltransferase